MENNDKVEYSADKLPMSHAALNELLNFLVQEISFTHVGLDSYALDVCLSGILKATTEYWSSLPRYAVKPYTMNRTFRNDYRD